MVDKNAILKEIAELESVAKNTRNEVTRTSANSKIASLKKKLAVEPSKVKEKSVVIKDAPVLADRNNSPKSRSGRTIIRPNEDGVFSVSMHL